jgi:hypothetical protein
MSINKSRLTSHSGPHSRADFHMEHFSIWCILNKIHRQVVRVIFQYSINGVNRSMWTEMKSTQILLHIVHTLVAASVSVTESSMNQGVAWAVGSTPSHWHIKDVNKTFPKKLLIHWLLLPVFKIYQRCFVQLVFTVFFFNLAFKYMGTYYICGRISRCFSW